VPNAYIDLFPEHCCYVEYYYLYMWFVWVWILCICIF